MTQFESGGAIMVVFATGVGQGAELAPFFCLWGLLTICAMTGLIIGGIYAWHKSLRKKLFALLLILVCFSVPFLSGLGLLALATLLPDTHKRNTIDTRMIVPGLPLEGAKHFLPVPDIESENAKGCMIWKCLIDSSHFYIVVLGLKERCSTA